MKPLNEKSKDYIALKVGLPFDEITEKSAGELSRHIEGKFGIKLVHRASEIFKRTTRGTPYLYFWKLSPSIKKIDKLLSKI